MQIRLKNHQKLSHQRATVEQSHC